MRKVFRMFPAVVPAPPKKRECGGCDGEGTVPVDRKNPRKGDKTCTRCDGTGEV